MSGPVALYRTEIPKHQSTASQRRAAAARFLPPSCQTRLPSIGLASIPHSDTRTSTDPRTPRPHFAIRCLWPSSHSFGLELIFLAHRRDRRPEEKSFFKSLPVGKPPLIKQQPRQRQRSLGRHVLTRAVTINFCLSRLLSRPVCLSGSLSDTVLNLPHLK